jgi:flagellar hook-associated protein 3 FlgL
MINRIGTRTGFESMMGLNQQTLQRTYNLQIQISSGLKAQNYSGISDVSGRLVNFEGAHTRLNQYLDDITVTRNRLQSAETQVDSIRDMANQFRGDLLNALNAENDQFQPTAEIAKQFMDQMESLLNTKDGDQYIFSGSRSDVAPVNLKAFSTTINVGTPNTEYYQGDDYEAFSRVGEGRTVTYGTTANDPTFEKLIRAMRSVFNSPNDNDNLRASLALVEEVAQKDIPAMISGIGVKVAQMDRIQDIHEQNILILTNTISEMKDTNIIDASAKISQENNILQASFIALSKIGGISLANYLR